ncbi:NAD(P)-dependent dehydrogenase (short-subunit alcohol dehydrogenase family) [Aeromicrobium panaciterrae]|uniref:NAD(P)-dependent dehydrogenase (Short-subunit alcohol dehydrogenase family) n=1 Tax=Aeromicrobium panaciterrae TaxID=363861 RepID=A0ABU1UL02_9ACTN|nr:SDR family oxidoreductase [Aeromicrobium panaciterrae]MDR7085852.1 NAD(P)-dependent dehydrogenase (short-subunit alcohol dehydrogenase family) [Aeromicrobium panaciterrae]
MTDISGKLVLVTGAASGIGRATAEVAAERGARVVLTDINPLDETIATIKAAGGDVAYAKSLDITDVDAVMAFAQEVHDAHGSVDVVMNVAGISAWGTVSALEHKHWRSMVEVNLMGPIHIIEAFVPAMVDAGRGGHLVNVSSAAGLIGMPWHAAYSASKFGLRGVSEVLRFDLRRHGIRVSLVCPGGVDTGLTETIEVAGVDKAGKAFKKAQAHFKKRAVTPNHAARAILRGVKRNRYMVYTSPDIFLAFTLQRAFPPGYSLAMRIFNKVANKVLPEAEKARAIR